jgi:GntR family transcriptional regulator
MKITIDPQLRTPVYRQIVDEVKRLVGSGVLRPGDRVDSVRELSHALGVNPATVAKAYRDLVSEGVLRTTSKSGTFVGAGGGLSPEASRARVAEALDRFLAEVAACSLDAGEIVAAVQRRLGELAATSDRKPPSPVEPKASPARQTAPRDDWAVW